MEERKGQITQALLAATSGDDDAANRLWSLVHGSLREMASRELRGEHRTPTISATGLVHEAFLKLVDASQVEWHNRSHFFAIACRAMRQILVDQARARNTLKRERGKARVPLKDAHGLATDRSDDLLALDAALEDLSKYDRRLGLVVEHRFFGGLTSKETAELLGISKRTADREWRRAKAYLYDALETDSK